MDAPDAPPKEQMRVFARQALDSISQLSRLIHLPRTSSSSSPTTNVLDNFDNVVESRPSGSTIHTHTGTAASTSSTRPGPSSAIRELQRRFPTTRPNARRMASPYARPSPRRPGRPHIGGELVTRNIVIVDANSEKVPSKSEKPRLERKRRIITGFDIDRRWDDKRLHMELESLLPQDWMKIAGFEILKNCSGSLIKPTIAQNKKIDAQLLFKSIAPSGSIYIRLLGNYFEEDDDDEVDDILLNPAFNFENVAHSKDEDLEIVEIPVKKESPLAAESEEKLPDVNLVDDLQQSTTTAVTDKAESSHQICPFDIGQIIGKVKEANLPSPVEILRFLQQEIVEGRPLEVQRADETIEGQSNYITVDREQILETTFSELEYIENFRLTFNVDFMGEECVDLGGPRKEWIQLMNNAIKEKLFDQGLRDFLAKEYYFAGIMIAVAMLQNGQLPAFIEENVLQEILCSTSKNECIIQLQKGLEQLGMLSAIQQLPELIHLLRPGAQNNLSVQKLLQLLKPKFSLEGSNARSEEKATYQMFIKYIREVAGGRRESGDVKMTLGHILRFATGASEEPVLGFQLPPEIQFPIPDELKRSESNDQSEEPAFKANFSPTARTCVNVLCLPRSTHIFKLPTMEKLFSLYDLTFGQSYFGIQ